MIESGDLRKGLAIELDGQLYTIVEYQHIKIGRGSAQVRLKLRDLRRGHHIERTFQAGEKFVRARLEDRDVQYLYRESNLFYFMDLENFEQIPLDEGQVSHAASYLKEGATATISTHGGVPIGVVLPITVDLEVTETGPSFKGDTASAGSKPATLETGLTVQVPYFVSNGDVVRIDTRSGEYVERVS